MPGRQADRFLQEGELWVIEAESLIDHMGLGLDADVQDGNGLATICHEGDLRRQMEEKRKPHFRSPEVPENMQGCAAELRAALLSSTPKEWEEGQRQVALGSHISLSQDGPSTNTATLGR